MASANELVFNASLGGAVIDKPIYEKPFIYEDDTYNNFDLNMSVIYGNSSTNITELFVNPFFMPWWQKTLWLLLFGVMVFVATSGNLIVIWIVLTEKRMRTVTNIFLVNLSIADAMVSTLNVIFSIIYMISGHWPFGRIYCKISQFVSLLSVAASVFTLMAISIDRYLAIMVPLRPRLGRKATLCIVVGIWTVSSGIAAPNFMFFTTEVTAIIGGGEQTLCFSKWPDGEQAESQIEYIYSIVITVLTYVLPMVSMGFTYTRMGLMLWGSQNIGEPTPNHIDAMKSKRKVVKMMIAVVVMFGVCWLPYHLYFILYTQFPEINKYKYIQEIFLLIFWLAMSNSMYNPMIYCWLNSRFRNGFKRVLAPWFPCLKCLNEPSLPKRTNTTHTNMFASIGSPEGVNRISGDDSVSLRPYFRATEKHQHPSILSTSSTTLRSNVSSRSNTATRSQVGFEPLSNGQGNKINSNGLPALTVDPGTPRCTTPV
ncbi:UNVERIFIED_CONTAM: hypothetical protein RMT77_011317 [Armadillidium vulgare]